MVKSPGAGWQNIVLRPMRLSPVLTRGNCLCAAHWRLAQATHAWPGGELHSAASPHLAAAGFRPSQLLCRSLASASVAQQADALPAVAALGPPRARPAAYGQPACDYTLLAACVRELQERWIPAKVDQAVLGSPTTLYLRLRSGAAAPAPPSTPPRAAPGAVAALVATVQPASKSGKLKKKDFLAGRAPPAAEEQAAASSDIGPPERAAPATPLPEVASGWLALSWHTWAARICIGSSPSRGDAAEAFSFGAQVRLCKSAHQPSTWPPNPHALLSGAHQVQQQLRGLVLLRAELPRAWERVCRLAFGPRLGGAPSHHIYLEVQGRRAFLVSSSL